MRHRYQRKMAAEREALALAHGHTLEARLKEQESRLREQLHWRRTLEKDLRRNERLDTIGALTTGVAHDFNNLMTVVISASETIATVAAERLTDIEREMLGEVLKAARSGAEITQQLLALTRSVEPQDLTPIDLGEFFEDTQSLFLSGSWRTDCTFHRNR